MNEKYFELRVTLSDKKELFSDFLFTLLPEGIEEDGQTLILRSEGELCDIEWGVKEFALSLSKAFHEEISVVTSIEEKLNEDWIKKYQDSVLPIEVGNLYIHPSWILPNNNMTDIIIDPALAFGSGHHESTYGSLLMLQRYVGLGHGFLDVGCGSGILGIAASKLGAIVDICDTDEQAVSSAKENFAKNNTFLNKSWIGSANSAGAKYDIVVANIIADILLIIDKDLKQALKENGVLIISGILDKYSQRVREKYNSLILIDEFIQNEWHTLVFKR